MFLKIKKVKPLKNYRLYVCFNFDIKAIYDAKFLFNIKSCESLKNIEYFNKVKIYDRGRSLVWNNEFFICAEELFENGKIARKEY